MLLRKYGKLCQGAMLTLTVRPADKSICIRGMEDRNCFLHGAGYIGYRSRCFLTQP